MDNNSTYFHTLANRRMCRKNIDYIYDNDGHWYDSRDDIANILVSHFSSVSCSSLQYIPNDIFDTIPTVNTDDLFESFTKIPTTEDILNKIKNMASWSSPGSDGFQAGFYQANWTIVGNDVVQAVQSFFTTGNMPRKFNKTYLSLISKTDVAKQPVNFRPIGSPKKFCKYIEQCVSTTKISILLNGSPTSEYSPTRGLRHGDPLSPYLFIITKDYLYRFIIHASSNHVIVGDKAARNAPAITHLLFADDILIFTKADMHNVAGILDTLSLFGKYSGQMLNFRKSSVYFSNNISHATRIALFNALDMTEMKDSDKKILSRDNFWRGKDGSGKGIYFIGWDKLRIPKALGGLRFRNLENLNTALLSKVAWKACNEEDTLCYKVLKAKYYKNDNILHLDKLKDDCSWLWRSIYSGLEVVQKHARWLVKSGTKINIWLDNWVIGLNSAPVKSGTKINIWLDNWVIGLNSPVVGSSSYENYTFVCDLFLSGTRQWNENIINALFSHDCANLILSMIIPPTSKDTLIWCHDRKDNFSVKSAYNTICFDEVNSVVVVGSIIPTDSNIPGFCLAEESLVCRICRPPEKDFVKVNIDGSYTFNTKKGSVGLIIRNHAGDCLGAKGKSFTEEVEECKEMEQAVDWMEELGLTKVIFEMYCEILVKSITDEELQVHWYNQTLLQVIKNKFRNNQF
ncbi:uncharacterized protein LOC113294912 [Papaver somniferum]|uniref:uncharacterized protein LOC113294912 n=1 Tax=Papaver somniferum TaxID=3469 RepID=UPI000E704401|nr:uncharacterized protein LOC113294912 [Papaver somniferum]